MHDDFDRSRWGLRPVHVDVWCGLIFVCLADQRPAPMADYIGAVDFGGYDFTDVRLASVKTHEIKANWKIVVENNLECYHCPINHPELIVIRDWKSTTLTKAMVDFDAAVKARAEGLEVIQGQIPCPHTLNGERICAVPFPRYDANDDPVAYTLLWEPGAVMILSRDHGWIFSPKPIGPARTELKQYWFVAGNASKGSDYEVARLQEFWDITMQQDRVICENVQKGMEMRGYMPGPLNRIHQVGQAGFYAWYIAQIRQRFAEEVR
ncbi:MAG: SRPBCC family protein [Steroidobacteraceae bacterium]